MDREQATAMAEAFNAKDQPWGCFFEGFGGGNALVFYMGRYGQSLWEEVRIPGDGGMALEELTDFCAIVGDTLEDCMESLSELSYA